MISDIIKKIIYYYSIFMFIYFFVVNILYILLIIFSLDRLREFVKSIRSDMIIPTNYTKPISIIVPAYNEQETIIENINSLLSLDYPSYEIIVVNDGSKDDTLKKIIEYYNLRKIDLEINEKIKCKKIKAAYSSFQLSKVIVIDKDNGGKSDALNAGINLSKYPFFCSIDADSVLEKDALFKLVKPFLKDEETIAAAGIVRIANGSHIKNGKVIKTSLPKTFIERFQIIEYLRAFLTSRVGWQKLNSLLIISGAFGLFRKTAAIEVGGYKNTIGEDMELTVSMHHHFRENKIPYKIDFISDAVCWTQAPDSLRDLKTQRIRWHRGLIDTLLRHRKMLFNVRYGIVGLLAMPYFWFIEMLGPVFEFLGYLFIIIAFLNGFLSKLFIFMFVMAFLFGLFFSICSILFELISYKKYVKIKHIVLLLFTLFFEQIIYRQLTVLWRVKAFINYKKGNKSWGQIKRKSFNGESGL